MLLRPHLCVKGESSHRASALVASWASLVCRLCSLFPPWVNPKERKLLRWQPAAALAERNRRRIRSMLLFLSNNARRRLPTGYRCVRVTMLSVRFGFLYVSGLTHFLLREVVLHLVYLPHSMIVWVSFTIRRFSHPTLQQL